MLILAPDIPHDPDDAIILQEVSRIPEHLVLIVPSEHWKRSMPIILFEIFFQSPVTLRNIPGTVISHALGSTGLLKNSAKYYKSRPSRACMRVLVTGGCGFIGSHICDALQADGHEVLALDNLSSGKRERVRCAVAVADITDQAALDGAFTRFRPEAVVHAAAQVMLRASLERPAFDAQQNIIGTINVLEACRVHGVRRVIYTSTGGARYGEPKRLPVTEDDAALPLSPYGISKHAAEHYVRIYARLHGISSLILAFGNVYGPRDDPRTCRVMSVFIDKLMRGERPAVFGDGEQTRDFLYVKDIAQVVARNLTKETEDMLFNLASGEQVSVNRIFGLVERELRTGLAPVYAPAVKGEVRDIVLDIARARAQLGFSPTPIEKGVEETVAWFRSAGAGTPGAEPGTPSRRQ